MQNAESPAQAYKRWIVETAARLRANDPVPRFATEADRRAREIRRRIAEAEGEALLPDRRAVPLNPQITGTLQRDGYRVEKLLLQTRPGCCATAHAYVPAARAKVPAVLAVHGHWQGARRDRTVQARNVGLAKLGFFVLSLDAWGAGERGTTPGHNEYHGGLLGASLWPVGTPLHGLQLHDNVRALDYIQSRPEVDPERIGCTGASGGGNQTTFLSAFDPRIKCGVPVCSVGRWQDYLNAACCVDEVLIGGLTFAEEGDLLGLVAPGALMVITARKDTYHFGPESAAQAVERASTYFRARGMEERIRHVLIDSGHDYNQPMREAMYGWMRRWLKDEGDGSPTPEPEVTTEDPETLRAVSASVRPARVMTTVNWVRSQAGELARVPSPTESRREWNAERRRRGQLLKRVLALPEDDRDEPDLSLIAPGLKPRQGDSPVVVVLNPQGREQSEGMELIRLLRADGLTVVTPELRACGSLTMPGQALGEAIPDHNAVEWGLWIGRPLLGQWVTDIRRVLTASGAKRAVLVGLREAALAAVIAAALDGRVRGTAMLDGLTTFVSDAVPHRQRMVVFSPDLLNAGDVQHLAGLGAPNRLLIEGPMLLDGSPLRAERFEEQFRWLREAYAVARRPEHLRIEARLSDAEVAGVIRGWCQSLKA